MKIFSEVRDFDRIRVFFGRTDLRISLSRAKFDEQADFEVRSAVARQKPRQISEKQNFRSEIFADFFLRRRKMMLPRPKKKRSCFWKSGFRSQVLGRSEG